MPLTEKIRFKTRLEKGSRLQVPKNERWHYKLETTQMLKVTTSAIGSWGLPQTFLKNMNKDGRIVIPKTTMRLMETKPGTSYILDVTLEPA